MPPTRLQKPKKSRTSISIDIKKEVCEYMLANPNIKHGAVALFFNEKYNGKLNIDRTTITKIWQNREKWLAVLLNSQTPHIFRQRPTQFPELDKALQIWTSQAVAAGLPLTDIILQQKGIELARMLNIGEDQLKFTNGWVWRFKQRNGLQKVNFSGEANSAPLTTLPEERVRLRALLAKYDKEDIYNADETGLFFRMEPNQTLSTGAVAGRKKDKTRLSILFCANATGSHKLCPLVIGKSLNPRCFKHFNKSALPVIYRANSKAWMRSDIFVEWIKHLDYHFRTMDRKILLLVDNAGSHFNPKILEDDNISDDESNSEQESSQRNNRKRNKKKKVKTKPDIILTNIELVYLPPNTTAHLQPMDAGIIHSFKAKYKHEFCKHLIHQFDSGIDRVKNKLNVKEAIDYIAEAWNNVTPTTIQNCWKKTEILPDFIDEVNVNDEEEDNMNVQEEDEIETLLNELPEAEELQKYFQMLDQEIPTEEYLTEEQIINMVLTEEKEESESEDDDEIPPILANKAVDGLKTFIGYFEQQDNFKYSVEDLHIFRKYLHVVKVDEFNSKKQSTLNMYYER